MSIADLIRKTRVSDFATATVATDATHSPRNHDYATQTGRTVAPVASVAVANPRNAENAITAANDPDPAKTHHLYLVTQPSGEQFTLSRNPSATLAEIQADYPGARIEPMPDPPPAPSLSAENLQLAYAVLRAWQETDTATGLEWIDGLARDPERLAQMHEQALAFGVARWEDAPTPASALTAPAEPPRQMAVCARCGHFEPDAINPKGGKGRCLTAAPKSRQPGACWPWPDAEISCREFEATR
jgi:hypothetical protein